jgi:hypothetical protein
MKPVLLLLFNRPYVTTIVVEALRQAKPQRLYVAADGPRKGNQEDIEKCEQVRQIATAIDWDCKVKTLFREENLGCKKAVSEGIDWFFEHETEGIILEDDCLPDQTFFKYCQELLEYYRHDNRIMVISGDNFQFGRKCGEFSYYFSRYNHCWGWASWRRAWKFYDVNMKLWPYIRDNGYLVDILGSKKSAQYWKKQFEMGYNGKIDSWDYMWTFSCWCQNGLSILPNINLVSNIGYGDDGTHTKRGSKLANMKSEEIEFPIKHPPFIIRNQAADNFSEKYLFSGTWLKRLARFIIKV